MAEKLKRYTTYLWQEQKRYPLFRIQTDDPRVARKLKKRKTTKQVSFGLNCAHWIFQLKYSSPKKAKNGLFNITGADVQKHHDMDVFVAYTYPHMALKEEC